LGGAAVVNFWAGKLCFLSLNVVVFLCFFLWLVVLFVVLIFVIKSSGKLCTFLSFFVDEVVVGAKYKINYKDVVIFSLACCCAKMIREVVLFKPKRCGFCCVFSCG